MKVPIQKDDMTDAQRACFDLLCVVFHGEHHVPKQIYSFGRGIKCSVLGGQLSTFDFDHLTRLVVLAHDHCVRVEVRSSGPGRIGLALHKRLGREGNSYNRHPTMEEALGRVRGRTVPAAMASEPQSVEVA